MFHDFIVSLYGETFYKGLAIFFKFYPIWLPLLAGIIFWTLWVRYVRYLFFSKTDYILLEIKIPREILKSPVAMEIAVLAFHQLGGEGTVFAKYWEGKVRAWSSLEIVSLGGEVHFYVWIRKNLRDIIESQFYSQYPNIEITEVADYAKPADFHPGTNDMWGAHYILTKPDAYPIKSYVDYGLDKDPKEELKNDPLTSLIEFLGSIKPGEQVWLQYIIRGHKKEKRGGLFSSPSDWRKDAEKERQKIIDAIKKDQRSVPTQGEGELIAGIERSLNKFPFDVGIRVVYFAETKEKYSGTTVNGLRGLMRPFSSQNLNGFKADKSTDFDYPWEDFRDIRVNRMKHKMLDAYKRRMYFFYPYHYKSMVLNNEELATIFHFPGATAATPGLPRIPSKRAQPPTNLPI